MIKKTSMKERDDRIVELVEQVKRVNGGKNSWVMVAQILNEELGTDLPAETVRGAYRRRKKGIKPKMNESNARLNAKRLGITENNEEKLITLLNRKYEINRLAQELKLTREQLLAKIMELNLAGFNIETWVENGRQYAKLNKSPEKRGVGNELRLNLPTKEFKIAIISDTHIGHRRSAREDLQNFIHYAYNQGVRTIFHAGDVVEGHYMNMRPDSIRELDAIGFDDQVELALKTFPKLSGLQYIMISGNHDWTFAKSGFANPVKTMTLIRDDFIYLGHNFGKVWLTDKVDLIMVHPTDGIGQNYSLKMRQHIERGTPDKLAKLIFMGHYHKFDHTYYKGIHGWIMPSFQRQSWFMSNNNLESIVGGIILTIRVDENGDLFSILPEYRLYDTYSE